MKPKNKKYLIALPNLNDNEIGVSGYNLIEKIGKNESTTCSGAISKYLFGKNPKIAKLIISKLNKEYKSLENFAFELPKKTKKDKLSETLDQMGIAIFLGEIYKNKPENYLTKAKDILSFR